MLMTASALIPISVTQTDGKSRADMGTEGGTVTCALKDRLQENSACRAYQGGGVG